MRTQNLHVQFHNDLRQVSRLSSVCPLLYGGPWLLQGSQEEAVVATSFSHATENSRTVDMGNVGFLHHRACPQGFWRREDVCQGCERKIAETQREVR